MSINNKNSNKKINMVSLFSGAGGMDLGFENQSFKNVFSVEFDNVFASTYINNFPKNKLFIRDIKSFTNEEIKKELGDKNVDVVIGGPPCQGFSKAGNIGRMFLDDERNYLFLEYVRFVSQLRPKMFVLENVAALATHHKGATIKSIIKEFNILGYHTKFWVVNSSDYGVPQDRRRVFIIGSIYDDQYEFPKKHGNKKKTIKDAIDDLPSLSSGESSEIPNHIAMNHTPQMLEKMFYVSDGGNRMDIPEDIRPKSGDIRKYVRYNSENPSFCVTGDMRKIFHYSQNRALTNRELARIQTFPDDFIFLGSSISIQQQIGNAVPPKLAGIVAASIREYLNERK